MSGNAPIDVTSVSSWNEHLRTARQLGHTVIADFHAEWCGPCKQIAPLYKKLASQYAFTRFLRVDVDGLGTKAIAAKYQISAMPTFIAIKPGDPSAKTGEVVQTLQGANPASLNQMIATHASHAYNPASTLASDEAEQFKKKANDAFGSGNYKEAIELYTKALAACPDSGVLYANRSFAYARFARSQDGSVEERNKARVSAFEDSVKATQLEDRWGKAWVRMGEAIQLSLDDEGAANLASDELRKENRAKTLGAAEEALDNAVRLSEGKIRADAEQKLDQVRVDLEAKS